MIRYLIALQGALFLLIGYLAMASVLWGRHENYAILGLLFFGGPALIAQFACMAVVLRRTRHDAEEEERRRAIAIALPGIGLILELVVNLWFW
jgi:hypothetical protein